jgi:hypothetical protein
MGRARLVATRPCEPPGNHFYTAWSLNAGMPALAPPRCYRLPGRGPCRPLALGCRPTAPRTATALWLWPAPRACG